MEQELTRGEALIIEAFEASMREAFASPGFVECIYNAGDPTGVGPRAYVLEEFRRRAVAAGFQAELVGTVIIVRRTSLPAVT